MDTNERAALERSAAKGDQLDSSQINGLAGRGLPSLPAIPLAWWPTFGEDLARKRHSEDRAKYLDPSQSLAGPRAHRHRMRLSLPPTCTLSAMPLPTSSQVDLFLRHQTIQTPLRGNGRARICSQMPPDLLSGLPRSTIERHNQDQLYWTPQSPGAGPSQDIRHSNRN